MAALLTKLANKLRRCPAAEDLVNPIRERALLLENLQDAELLAESLALSNQGEEAGLVDDPKLLVPAAALITESIRRVAGIRLHDVQLRGGLVVASGRIAEMQTGEGKTFVAVVAAYLQAITRRGVHVSTTNAYLANRDYEIVSPMVRPLGITVGLLEDQASVVTTRAAYNCDVTYGTGYQFGFDFLRDQLARRQHAERSIGHDVVQSIHGLHDSNDHLRQRQFAMAIVDEADSVMIDEAMVPLIISGEGSANESVEAYRIANDIAAELIEDVHYEIDPRSKSITLTTAGRTEAHRCWDRRSIPSLVRPWTKYIENALQANIRFQRDQHYVLKDGTVQIVDQNTGRIFSDRTWRDGLHQAVEAKEAVEIQPSEQSVSRITRQRFFNFYERVGGLTGTITESRDEIQHFYNLGVVQIPTNVPCNRVYLPARYFATNRAKRAAIADSVKELHEKRRPVLVGTTTIEESLALSEVLSGAQISHLVLNGMQDDEEAGIISRAGHAGTVLVATNMAGRGTDIKPCEEAKSLGGLHVIAAQHALSPRIDRQLVGRAARQSDPGSCQYFASAEDELISNHDPALEKSMVASADANGECIRDFSDDIARLQSRIEAAAFESRRKSVQSDYWFDQIRETLH